MTPAELEIRQAIREHGPLSFSAYMQLALYHPLHGYYSKARREHRDPFGKQGDFFTASQLQPVFGRIAAQAIDQLLGHAPHAAPHRVTEWAPGRGEMGDAFARFAYRGVESGDPPPQGDCDAIFANEFFDALPVDLARREDGHWHQMRVGDGGDRLEWRKGEPLSGEWLDYARQAASHLPEGSDVELELPVRLKAATQAMIDALSPHGHAVWIDYGYTERELVRFPRGTLLGYRRHRAVEDVLFNPGEQDITAHVPFDHLRRTVERCGARVTGFETMAQWILRTGEPDQFAAVLRNEVLRDEVLRHDDEAGTAALRLQLKTLLFGMGETFRVMSVEKAG